MRVKDFPTQIMHWVMSIHHVDQQTASYFECHFCVSCALYIATLLTLDNGPFLTIFSNVTIPLLTTQNVPATAYSNAFTTNQNTCVAY